jgi:hypothetical protein
MRRKDVSPPSAPANSLLAEERRRAISGKTVLFGAMAHSQKALYTNDIRRANLTPLGARPVPMFVQKGKRDADRRRVVSLADAPSDPYIFPIAGHRAASRPSHRNLSE